MNYSIFAKRANKWARDQLDVYNRLIKKWAENDERDQLDVYNRLIKKWAENDEPITIQSL